MWISGRRTNGQRGQVFLVVLILMLVTSLVVTPLIRYMFDGRAASIHNEDRMDELYAADAGVEDAINSIRVKNAHGQALPDSTGEIVSYNLGTNLNGETVNPIGITYVDDKTFRIFSAASKDSRYGTVITSYLNIVNFPGNLLKNVLTSPNDVDVGNGSTISGNISSPVINLPNNPHNYTWTGDNVGAPKDWPPYVGLADFYFNQIYSGNYTYKDADYTIRLDPGQVLNQGALYVNGNLTIDGQPQLSNKPTLNLTGVIYATGGITFTNNYVQVNLGNTANESSYAFYAEANGYTPSGPPYSIDIPSAKITISGPGAVISEEAINFQPGITSSQFLFVLSTHGRVWFKPGGTFTGSIAGDVKVDLQPNSTITWSEPPPFLNVPGSDYVDWNVIQRVLTWDISYYDPSGITITTLQLSNGDVGVPYNQALVAFGGIGRTWFIVPGSLPLGLSLVGSSITGTPTTAGTWPFEVEVTDEAGRNTTQTLSITIDSLTVTSPSTLLSGWVAHNYSQTLTADHGKAPYGWTVTSGSLPAGLSLVSSGVISGTCSAPSSTTFTVTVTDALGNAASKDISLTFSLPPVITTDTAAKVGIVPPFSGTFTGQLTSVGGALGTKVTTSFEWGTDNVTFPASIDVTTGQPMTVQGVFSALTPPVFSQGVTYYVRSKGSVSADGSVPVDVFGGAIQFKP